MSLPSDPLSLIRWANGAPKFETLSDKGGVGALWWSEVEESKVFIVVCAEQYALAAGLNHVRNFFSGRDKSALGKSAKRPPLLEATRADIEAAGWTRALNGRHWDDFASPQLRQALEGRPMLLQKALFAIVLIKHALTKADPNFDAKAYFEHVHIVPAAYKIADKDDNRLDTSKLTTSKPVLEALAGCNQVLAKYLLSEHAGGKQLCYDSAKAILKAANADEYVVKIARRRGLRGNLIGASSHLRYAC